MGTHEEGHPTLPYRCSRVYSHLDVSDLMTLIDQWPLTGICHSGLQGNMHIDGVRIRGLLLTLQIIQNSLWPPSAWHIYILYT